MKNIKKISKIIFCFMILMLTIVFASNVSAAVITTYVMDKDDLDNYGVYAIAIDTKTTHWL